MKKCSVCNRIKSADEFPKRGLRCKVCTADYKRAYYLANKERIKQYRADNRERIAEYQRGWVERNAEHLADYNRSQAENSRWRKIWRKFGITREDYEALYRLQGEGCAICGTSDDILGRSLAVDHCHRTGQVRGLLCTFHKCGAWIVSGRPRIGAARGVLPCGRS